MPNPLAEVVDSGSFYRITREPALGIYRMNCEGTLQARPLALAGKKSRTAALEDGFGLLIDFRGCELPISITTTFQWFKNYYTDDELHLRFVKTAWLYDEKDEELLSFAELSWRNRGSRSRAFQQEDEAIAWLNDPAT